jgi:hypothetical protein
MVDERLTGSFDLPSRAQLARAALRMTGFGIHLKLMIIESHLVIKKLSFIQTLLLRSYPFFSSASLRA